MNWPANRMRNDNPLKLGIFSPNCSGGMAVTTVPERWDPSWDNNAALAVMADGYGIEFLLPIARWRGYGGETNFQGTTLETMTWCAGLLALTKGITVFCTAHTSFHHPLVAAKMLSTVDQISHGRLGLNVVCGWNQPEYEMMGKDLPDSHDDRYDYGQEWLDVIEKVWTSDAEFAAGHGVYPLVGDPDHIASELERVHRAGFDGTTISFVDYLAELPYFAEEVIPRLEAKGLRSPVPSA